MFRIPAPEDIKPVDRSSVHDAVVTPRWRYAAMPPSGRIKALIELTELENSDRWARAHAVAHAIPQDVDLNDDADVIRSLFAQRYCCADFADVLSEAIQYAQEARQS